MQYNTQRNQLVMPEYGRGVQKMVELAVSLPDKQARQQCAKTIVSIMSRIHPEDTNPVDSEHRLWNHLAKISGYKLDIDYPVDIVQEDEAKEQLKPLHYPMQKIRRRHYGHLIERRYKAGSPTKQPYKGWSYPLGSHHEQPRLHFPMRNLFLPKPL